MSNYVYWLCILFYSTDGLRTAFYSNVYETEHIGFLKWTYVTRMDSVLVNHIIRRTVKYEVLRKKRGNHSACN